MTYLTEAPAAAKVTARHLESIAEEWETDAIALMKRIKNADLPSERCELRDEAENLVSFAEELRERAQVLREKV